MKKPMLALLAAFSCAALTLQVVRADDGPDLKDTLKSLKRYTNEEAGGQFGPGLGAGAASGATGLRNSISYAWIDKDWGSPDEATADVQLTVTDRSTNKITYVSVLSVKLKALKLDGLTTEALPGFGHYFLLKIPVNEAVTVTTDGKPGKVGASVAIFFPTEEARQEGLRRSSPGRLPRRRPGQARGGPASRQRARRPLSQVGR